MLYSNADKLPVVMRSLLSDTRARKTRNVDLCLKRHGLPRHIFTPTRECTQKPLNCYVQRKLDDAGYMEWELIPIQYTDVLSGLKTRHILGSVSQLWRAKKTTRAGAGIYGFPLVGNFRCSTLQCQKFLYTPLSNRLVSEVRETWKLRVLF